MEDIDGTNWMCGYKGDGSFSLTVRGEAKPSSQPKKIFGFGTSATGIFYAYLLANGFLMVVFAWRAGVASLNPSIPACAFGGCQ